MPVLAPTAPSLSNRREQVIWTRLPLGHTRLTHRHLLLGEPPPYCEKSNVTSLCGRLTSCPSCLENTYGCVWCGSSCSHGRCGKNIKETNMLDKCEVAESSNCDKLHNCHACHTEYHCGWQTDEKCYTFVRESSNGTEKAILNDDYRVKCEIPCSSRYTCENCTQGPCMWCSSQQMCIESNAYAAVFPVAQCMEWTTQITKCREMLQSFAIGIDLASFEEVIEIF
ncbi:attractin [Trichonephila clavipes]|nr:attractin [Trichonephila clavipes]